MFAIQKLCWSRMMPLLPLLPHILWLMLADEASASSSNGAADFNGAATSLADSSTARFTELTLDEFR